MIKYFKQHKQQITAIYTPNANGGFDLQWENNENK